MGDALFGVIGGSGLGERLVAHPGVERITLDTPFGKPSDALLRTKWNGIDVVFLNRHGPGHTLNPTTVPYRANIFAMKSLGVNHIIASGAVGSLREEIQPGNLVVCDQVIDKTTRRTQSFFEDCAAVHVEMADPFCDSLRNVLLACADRVQTTVHAQGTYVTMEGPAFSTRAESLMHRQWGGDLIGMTCMPEAKLAREAEICYAMVALATDYDCWRPSNGHADKQALLAEIIGNLKLATDNAVTLIEEALKRLNDAVTADCPCRNSLQLGIWSDKSQIDSTAIEDLRALWGRYF